MEVGVPVAEAVEPDGEVVAGVLPAGRYAMVSHIGHPKELMGVTTELLAWADRQGLRFDMTPSEDGERWGCRLEVYHSDPHEVPDMAQWHTDLVFRLADLPD
jgi:DNA gyrase inhibitor GyrI